MSTERLKDKIGEEGVDEIAEKKWNAIELTKETVDKINKKSKRKMNRRSLQNLAQYKKEGRDLEGKEKSLKNLRVKKSKDDINIPKPITGDETKEELIEKMVPYGEVLEPEEQAMHENYLRSFLSDFKEDDLSQSDIDDIIQLSMNRVLEYRLLKGVKGKKANELMEATLSIERIRKYNDKIKENLATRRRDRIVPGGTDDVSIVDIAASFDEEKKKEAEAREADLLAEEEEFKNNRKFKGNCEDEDVTMELNS